MSLIHVPRRRIAQPVGPTGVDARALLGSKVILAVPFNGARAFGRAAGPITFGANGSLAGSAVGLALNGGSSAAIASVPLDLSAYNAITVSALVYLRDVSGPDHMIWELTSDGLATTGGFALYAASGGGKFETGHHGDVGMSATGWLTVPANGTWNHIAVVHDFSAANTGEMKFFLNGVEKPTYAWDAIPENTAASRFANSTLYFLNRAMSSLPTDAMMSAFAILEGNQAAYVPMLAANPWQLFAPERDFVFFPAASGSTTVSVSPGSLVLTGQSVTNTTTGVVGAGSLTLTGQSIGVVQTIAVTPGTLSLTGQDVTANTTVGVTAGSLTLTGSDVTVVPPSGSSSVTVDPGSLTLTGQSITGTVSVPVTQGDTTLTGQTIGVTITVPVDAGTLTLTGQSVSASVVGSTTVSIDPGTLTLTGYDVTVTYTGGTKGGAAKGKNLTLKQKKKLKAVISQEWLKAEETAKELFQERLKDVEPAKVKIEKLTEAQSLAEVIVALKALSKETVTLPEQQVVLKSINKTIVAKTEKPVEKVNTIETRLIQFEKQLANIEELILMVLAEVS